MLYYILKILSSAIILVIISEVSKRSTLMGSILASLPLVSLLAIIWLYIDTRNIEKVADLSTGIFWMVLPSLIFFVLFPVFLRKQFGFWASMGLSLTLMVIFYFLMIFVLRKFGIRV